MHERAHDEEFTEKRRELIITHGMRLVSHTLGLSGQCDVVEFHASEKGIQIIGWDGLWIPYPVEYKHGNIKVNDCDRSQVCAQAICLEEMLCCHIEEGALYYGEPQRREIVPFTELMRNTVKDAAVHMHEMYSRGYTPKVRKNPGCRSCSIKDICLPELLKTRSVNEYIGDHL